MTRGARPLATALSLLCLLTLVLACSVGGSRSVGAVESPTPARNPSPGTGLPTRAPAPVDPGEPFSVTVDSVTPTAPGPEDTLVVTGRVAAAERLSDVTVRPRVGRPLTSRSALARADDRLASTSTRSEAAPVADVVRAGEVATFRLAVPASELRLESLGVHPLQVEVRARVALDESGEGVGELVSRRVQTFLPTFPEPVQPTRLAVVLPLTRPPVPVAAGEDDLALELAAGGRLSLLLEAGAAAAAASVPVTWIVDPALLDTVQALASAAPSGTGENTPADTGKGAAGGADDGTGVVVDGTPTGEPATGPADGGGTAGDGGGDPTGRSETRSAAASAAVWLERARETLAAGSVLALPYADADVVALVDSGLGSELELALEEGRAVVRRTLGLTPLPEWGWPPDGVLTGDALEALVAAGTRRLLLDPAAVDREQSTPITPDARVELQVADVSVEVLTPDTGLTALLAPGTADTGASAGAGVPDALALQRFAAETAALTAERPGASRAAVLMPPRYWEPDAAFARRLLTGLAEQPWLQPTTLTALHGDAVDPGPGSEPAAVSEAELAADGVAAAAEQALPDAWMAPLRLSRNALAAFAPVLSDVEPVLTPRRLLLLRGAGAAWRDPDLRPVGAEVVALAERAVADLLASVRLEGGGPVLFTAEAGTIPLTVVNELDQEVSVLVTVDAAGQARLLTGAATEVTVEPGRRRQVDVRIAARTSGQFPVTVQLRSPTGTPVGAPTRVTVRSTAYGRVAVAITAGAAAVLVVAAGTRLLRRAWRSRRALAADRPSAVRPHE